MTEPLSDGRVSADPDAGPPAADPGSAVRSPLGAILAGGRSRRFGAPKHAAVVNGRPLLQWVHRAVCTVAEPVFIGGDVTLAQHLGMRARPDLLAGKGPLGGIQTALCWAEEEARPGALCVACDTPFLPAELLRLLLERFERTDAHVVAPESAGPLGLEPLCAVYRASCLPEIRRRVRAGEHGLGRLLHALRTERLPLAEVERLGDPAVLFFNVNTPDQYRRALELADAP